MLILAQLRKYINIWQLEHLHNMHWHPLLWSLRRYQSSRWPGGWAVCTVPVDWNCVGKALFTVVYPGPITEKKWCVPALCLRNCTSWNYDVPIVIRSLEQYRVLFSCVTTFLTRKNPYLSSVWTDTRDKIVFPLLIVSKVDRYLFVCPRIHNSIQYQTESHKHSTTAVSMTRYFRKSLRCNENHQSTSSGNDDRNLFYKIPSRPPKTFSLNFHVKKGLCSRKTHNETIIIMNFLKATHKKRDKPNKFYVREFFHLRF